MSRIAHAARESARRTSDMLRRGGESVTTRYRASSDELRNAATGLTNAVRHGNSKIRWALVTQDALALGGAMTAGFMLSQYSAEPETPPRSNDGPVQEVDALIRMSPTLAEAVLDIEADGWIIRWGTKGSGYYADRGQKLINIAVDVKGDDLAVTDLLAHEVGHAYEGAAVPSVVPPREGMTRAQWIDEHLYAAFIGEAEAGLVAAQVRQEILDNGGPDIQGVSNGKVSFTVELYQQYSRGDISREAARSIIARTNFDPNNRFYYDHYYPYYKELSNKYFGN